MYDYKKAIDRTRRKIGLTQQELALKAGVSEPTLSQINQKQIRVTTLHKISKALNMRTWRLIQLAERYGNEES